MNGMTILDELSEFISLRMKSSLQSTHNTDWIEHKAHLDYDLWFIQTGMVKLIIDGKEYIAQAGDVIFFYPGIPYIASTNNDGCRFIYIHFDFEIGKQQRILQDFQLSGIMPHDRIKQEVDLLVTAFNNLQHSKGVAGTRLYLKACLTAVVAKIIELHSRGQYIGEFTVDHTAKKLDRNLETFQPVFDYVNSYLHQSIRMSELAALIGISEKYFITSFKKALGITPGQYIYQVKMNRARDYLLAKKYNVQQIAALLGYPDPFTFSKAFKKYYHVSPSKFE
jgi:AraC family transcriptional regulator